MYPYFCALPFLFKFYSKVGYFYKILREILHENVDDEVNPWSSIIKQVFGLVLLKEYHGNDN